ncbi:MULTISPECIES: hypothetical protein [Wolbachia]|nr:MULTISPECIES: hypothetical protein [Wolbachia]UYC23760.1 hypothetical protein L3551_00550 [Wolbachia endosymbiont of Aedes aegypti]
MIREKSKELISEDESTDAENRGGSARNPSCGLEVSEKARKIG